MEKIDLQNVKHRIIIVSRDNVVIESIKQGVQSNDLLREQSSIMSVLDLSDIQSEILESICVVLMHVNSKIGDVKTINKIYVDIERVRTKNTRSTIGFIALCGDMNSGNQGSLVAGGGVDIILYSFDVSNILHNVYGFIRFTRMLLDQRRSTSEREDNVMATKVGGWTLLPRFRSVKLPKGNIRKLTETEWYYLCYLVERDITKANIPEYTEREVGQSIRQNAIVYKIKKKLGASFPIVSSGMGNYRILANSE